MESLPQFIHNKVKQNHMAYPCKATTTDGTKKVIVETREVKLLQVIYKITKIIIIYLVLEVPKKQGNSRRGSNNTSMPTQ